MVIGGGTLDSHETSISSNHHFFSVLNLLLKVPLIPLFLGWVSTVGTVDSVKDKILSWESKVPPPKATPPINKALLRDY